MSLTNRIVTHAHISTKLEGLSDVMLSDLLHQAEPMHSGIGGTSMILILDDIKLFVKKIALTDLERQPQYEFSTANMLNLPLFYQYGVGSAGFGSWRELAAHKMTSNWVLSKDCPNFPLLYHWRILPTLEPINTEQPENLERDIKYWEHSSAVRARLQAIHDASKQIVIFLEYAPETLHQWLGKQVRAGGKTAEEAISFVEESLNATNNFMNANGLIHFDAHFENILTDGHIVLFSDFGLALSSNFQLTNAERDFFKNHQTYDRCSTIVNLLHCVITSLFGKDQWEGRLQEYINGERGNLAPSIDALIKKYAPIALVMDKFYLNLQKVSKSTPYPAAQLDSLLNEIDKEIRVWRISKF